MAPNELKISTEEHKNRIAKIQNTLRRNGIDALYLTNSARILYTTGFAHISTERPLAAVIPNEKPPFFMAPHLEYDHVREECPLADEVLTYPDYPGKIHPIRVFAKFMAQKGFASSKIATDSVEGAAGGYGYRGPALRDLMRRAKFIDGRDIVDKLRLTQSRQEIRLLRESAKWSDIAHGILLENTHAGLHDALVAVKSSYDAALKEFRPGITCNRVDEAARKSIEDSGLIDAHRHHTGHGIGLDGHEPPWLDPGDRTVMREGMVFSCEPGLYFPGYAGFRHSDTVVITKKGVDFITHYPRGLEELTL